MKILKERDEKFCRLIIEGVTHVDAYLQAGFCPNGKRESANRQAKRKLHQPRIIKLLAELQAATTDNTVMSVLERKRRLSEIARARVTDFTACKDGVARINIGLESANSAALQEVVTDEIKLGRGEGAPIVQLTKLKLRDPVAAIQELNKMGGDYPPEKHEVTGRDGKPLEILVRWDGNRDKPGSSPAETAPPPE